MHTGDGAMGECDMLHDGDDLYEYIEEHPSNETVAELNADGYSLYGAENVMQFHSQSRSYKSARWGGTSFS